jgi:hypothetical protein
MKHSIITTGKLFFFLLFALPFTAMADSEGSELAQESQSMSVAEQYFAAESQSVSEMSSSPNSSSPGNQSGNPGEYENQNGNSGNGNGNQNGNGNGGNGNAYGWNPTNGGNSGGASVPLDGGLSLLIAAGAGIGIKKYKQLKNGGPKTEA